MSPTAKAQQAFSQLNLDSTSHPETMASFCHDQSTVAATKLPWAVVFPHNHQQVLTLVKWANDFSVALLVSGGRTGLSGGAVLVNESIVVSLEKMQRLLSFDNYSPSITVEAGMTIANLQALASEQALQYPVDYASRDSAQIGGALATNAGGIKVIKYGMTRNWVLGLNAVTGSGEELLLDKNLKKDNSGYDVTQLLIGSEGTLAIITEVTVALAPPEKTLTTVLLGFDSMAALQNAYLQCRQFALVAAEFFCANSLQAVLEQKTLTQPFSKAYDYYLLVDFEQQTDLLEALASKLESHDILVAQSLQQQKTFWSYREHISACLHRLKPYKNDVSCLLQHWQKVIEQLYPLQKKLGGQLYLFGHIGDGNMHINSVGLTDNQPAFDQGLLAILQNVNGSISAEHGIGLLKRDKLLQSKSATEVALYRQIKQVFDPRGILNPGKLLAID